MLFCPAFQYCFKHHTRIGNRIVVLRWKDEVAGQGEFEGLAAECHLVVSLPRLVVKDEFDLAPVGLHIPEGRTERLVKSLLAGKTNCMAQRGIVQCVVFYFVGCENGKKEMCGFAGPVEFVEPLVLFNVNAAAQYHRLIDIDDLVFVLYDEQLHVDELPDGTYRVLDAVLSDGFKFDVQVIFLLKDLNQFKEHQ